MLKFPSFIVLMASFWVFDYKKSIYITYKFEFKLNKKKQICGDFISIKSNRIYFSSFILNFFKIHGNQLRSTNKILYMFKKRWALRANSCQLLLTYGSYPLWSMKKHMKIKHINISKLNLWVTLSSGTLF